MSFIDTRDIAETAARIFTDLHDRPLCDSERVNYTYRPGDDAVGPLVRALQEYGRLVRTIYLCRYLADEELRRRVRRQLNKGESLHALRRDLFFAHQGHVRRRHLDDQVD